MKTCIIGNVKAGKGGSTYSWFCLTYSQGLRLNGHQVMHIDHKTNSLEKIRQRLIQEKPRYAFTHLTCHGNVHNPYDTMQMYKDVKRAVGTRFIHTLNDARHEPRYSGDISHAIDAAFIGSAYTKKFQNYWKVPTYYSPYTSLTYDKMASPAKDLSFGQPVFTGSVRAHRDRSQFIQQLQQVMPIKTFQTQSGNDLRHRTPELSVSAKCILGLCTGYDVDGFVDVRPFQYLGTGAFMIMRKFMNMDKVIPDDLYVPFDSYNNPIVVKDLWDEWKNKDTTEIRKKAFDFIQQFHSSKVRMEQTIEILEGKRDKLDVFIND